MSEQTEEFMMTVLPETLNFINLTRMGSRYRFLQLPNSDKTAPYVFVGDEAFQLEENFMKPYSLSVLNIERRYLQVSIFTGKEGC
jgi:hypothetical protein